MEIKIKMKSDENAIRHCINKNCQKPLPKGYKHLYCEACRNKHADNFKTGVKAGVGAAGVVLSTVVLLATGGKINIDFKK